MRIFFSVGEPSGDLHGSNLIRRLKSQRPDIECVGFGGPKMAAAGCELHFELTTMAVMFLEALKNIRFFFRLIAQADDYFAKNDIDAVVLIDYPGFNWWIAKKAKQRQIPVFYYGVPQMWAWAPWRVRKIRKYVDHVLCKLPFEVDWFAARNCKATYVGHPYFDQLQSQQYDQQFIAGLTRASQDAQDTEDAQDNDGKHTRLLALLPGSRDQEVRSVLPLLLSAAEKTVKQVQDCGVVVACYNQKQQAMAQEMIRERGLAYPTFVERTPELMVAADVCLACSGSVSLELLHHRKPTIILFKVKRWLMAAQAILMRCKYITLVNLIAAGDIERTSWRPYDPDAVDAQEAVMPEYLTTGDPSDKVAARTVALLSDESLRQENIDRLDELARQYAIPGATDRAADYILEKILQRLGVPENSRSEDSQEQQEKQSTESPENRSAA